MKRRIFIGSSTEGINQASQVCQVLSKLEATEGVMWTTVFEPGFLTFDALESMLQSCCAAVLIATPDDVSKIRGKRVRTPRSNIMLEFGLVAGRLGLHSTALCQYGGAELPSDLKGLTVISMDPSDTANGQTDIDAFRQHAEEKLRIWSAGLLATAPMVPRTEMVHGYTGIWEFSLQLHKWRNLPISSPSFADINGVLNLFLSANGQVGRGVTQGRIFFKLIENGQSYQGEYRSSHTITNALCHTDGSLEFTGEAFVLQKVNSTGSVPPELTGLDFAPEPWMSRWQLRPTQDPRTLEGTVRTDGALLTEGTVRAVKSPGFM
jgi:hypothetical protein